METVVLSALSLSLLTSFLLSFPLPSFCQLFFLFALLLYFNNQVAFMSSKPDLQYVFSKIGWLLNQLTFRMYLCYSIQKWIRAGGGGEMKVQSHDQIR